jgi:hypothetical protein
MQIFIKDFAKKTHTMDIYKNDNETVDAFIERFLVQSKMPDIPLIDLRLLNSGKMMLGSALLFDYDISMHSTLTLIKLERGGAPKPWSANEKPKPTSLGIF